MAKKHDFLSIPENKKSTADFSSNNELQLIVHFGLLSLKSCYATKNVFNNYGSKRPLLNLKIVAVADRWSLFRGHYLVKISIWASKWWSLAQVRLYSVHI